jgi:hypothetical protein
MAQIGIIMTAISNQPQDVKNHLKTAIICYINALFESGSTLMLTGEFIFCASAPFISLDAL